MKLIKSLTITASLVISISAMATVNSRAMKVSSGSVMQANGDVAGGYFEILQSMKSIKVGEHKSIQYKYIRQGQSYVSSINLEHPSQYQYTYTERDNHGNVRRANYTALLGRLTLENHEVRGSFSD